MRHRNVILGPKAIDDLYEIHKYIEGQVGSDVANSFIARIKLFIRGFELASERGTLQNNLRKGLRVVGFERRITIAFTVNQQTVKILRIFRAGKNWQDEF